MTLFEPESFWQDSEFIKFDETFFTSSGFEQGDIKALCYQGFPDWAAPNMNFDHFCQKPDSTSFKIGEDRDERDIWIDIQSRFILCSMNKIFVNSSAQLFRETLKLYGQMIESAIALNSKAATNNTIPDVFITNFRDELSLIDHRAIVSDSFWYQEIERRYGHCNPS
jgi:hypothetical protein